MNLIYHCEVDCLESKQLFMCKFKNTFYRLDIYIILITEKLSLDSLG